MAKAIKKKRRMKKTVRKTLGTLFLISSLLVAAIPVENLQADNGTGTTTKAISVGADDSVIPKVTTSHQIYASGDGMFQFAHVQYGSSNAYVAVIVDYTNVGGLAGGTLEIPNTIDAYRSYEHKTDYVAVNVDGDHMYYKVEVEEDNSGDTSTEGEEAGTTTPTIPLEPIYKPCYYETREEWINGETLYYNTGTTDAPVYKEASVGKKRLADVPVCYIGNQYVTASSDGSWTVNDVTTADNGIFAGETNITSLIIGDNMVGIGNYAFYQCSGLNTVTLANGLATIGNYAFAECRYLSAVNINVEAPIDTIGAYAFNNCLAITSFTVPKSVKTIGDSAFEGCIQLRNIDLSGDNGAIGGFLTTLGAHAFKNCSIMQSIDFPSNFYNGGSALDLSVFDGCKSLKYISSPNASLKFVGTELSFADFRTQVEANGFYFQGLEGSELHKIAKGGENPTEDSITFAFSYLDDIQYLPKDIYEMTIHTSEGSPVYRVNSANYLISSDIPAGMTKVELPEKIGPYAIATIGTNTFDKVKCTLEQVIIPSSVNTISAYAFKGCHALKNVIFATPCNVTSIGTDAFKTQVQDVACEHKLATSGLSLRFVGPIATDCEPFNFAMSSSNSFNNGQQEVTYIEYYSGWPQNLVVQYDAAAKKAALIDYPTFTDLLNGTFTKTYPDYPTGFSNLATSAVTKYKAGGAYVENEQLIVDAVLNIEIPEGVEMIKEGLFATKEAKEISDSKTAEDLTYTIDKKITAYGLNEVAAESFSGCTNLTEVALLGNTTYIGDYAFDKCANLETVYLPASLTEMGLRPFRGCTKLSDSDVVFEGDNFDCEKSIIFQNTSYGRRVIEYLEGRTSGYVEPSEMEGVIEVAEEAFMGTKVNSVDFRTSEIAEVPERAFAETTALAQVYLPDTCFAIRKDAFKDSSIKYVMIPGSVATINNDAFSGNTNKSELTFSCEPGSTAYIYAEDNGISINDKDIVIYYTVTFWDSESNILGEPQRILAGQDAVPPEAPAKEGYTFTGWLPDYRNVQANISPVAQYQVIDTSLPVYTVTFINWDDTTWSSQKVTQGDDAIIPQAPTKDGYTFTGWRPAVTDVQNDIITYAQFERNPDNAGTDDGTGDGNGTGDGTGDGTGNETGNGTGDGTGNGTGNGTGDGTGNGTGNGTDDNNTNKELYTLTVENGSGSGSYVEGAQPIIIANDPPTGKVFDSWTIDPADTTIASKKLSATVITMPDGNVTVTANYKTSNATGSTASGNNSNSGSSSSSSSNKGSGSNTVIIDKNGLSNTGVVNVTVNGSSDNFTVKINESASATEAIIKALKAEYGDISNIKYFPMDISLYDSTGKTKITDTKGLSISITLPLPDSLITYAGNNKVAGVVNEKLDKLNPRFTTIDGVSCITFTCEHFSPYVIYVETNNLSSDTVADSTPKTGDGIHPKWFLSIGLALIAVVLFMKKDQQTAVHRVRA